MTTKILKIEATPVAGCLVATKEFSIGGECVADTYRLFVSKNDEYSTDRLTVWELTGWCELDGVTSKKLTSESEVELPAVMHSLQQILTDAGWC